MSSFSLKKWYLDAADDKGNLYIGYWIRLQWKSTTLHGYQHLWHTPQTGIQSSGKFKRQLPPKSENNQINWSSGQVRGTWISKATGIEETLLATNKGSIHWHCIQPKAKATISLPSVAIQGWGYVECRDITVPIWRLPFKTLYWGRCHTHSHYLTWIRWEGDTEQNLLWHNGQCYKDANITDTAIEGPGVSLELKPEVSIRQGNLLSTVLRPFAGKSQRPHFAVGMRCSPADFRKAGDLGTAAPVRAKLARASSLRKLPEGETSRKPRRIAPGSFTTITKLLPQKSLSLNESKWYGTSVLETKGVSEQAVVIFEEVTW